MFCPQRQISTFKIAGREAKLERLRIFCDHMTFKEVDTDVNTLEIVLLLLRALRVEPFSTSSVDIYLASTDGLAKLTWSLKFCLFH